MQAEPGSSMGHHPVMVAVLGDVHAGELLHGRRHGPRGAGTTEPLI